jgi:hypothetical protein
VRELFYRGELPYNGAMSKGAREACRRIPKLARLVLCLLGLAACLQAEERPLPAAKNARILLVPRRMVSGDRVTLAVLDLNGRLTPGVIIAFSNGDHITTDSTGRGLFVAPLTPGVLYATIAGRPGRVETLVLAASGTKTPAAAVGAPHFASLADRFELQGHGFCGDADNNVVQVNGQKALVLASSSESITALPPEDLEPGVADVTISCNKREPGTARITFLELALRADTSPMQPGQQRTLKVRVNGTQEKVALEARNLAPDIAELAGGNPARAVSSGGPENSAVFPITGKQHGNVLVSIRLIPGAVRNKP